MVCAKPVSRRPIWGIVLLGLLWLGVLAGLRPLWVPWENHWRDNWLAEKSPGVACDPRILLVLIDDHSLERIPQPTAYWLPLLSKVTRASLEQGALAVGWDWMPHEVDEATYANVFKHGWGQPLPWTDLGEVTQRFPGRWIQGIFPHLDSNPGQDYRPASVVMGLAGADDLAYLNMSRDRDGVFRRQAVVPLKLEGPLWHDEVCQGFAARLAESAGPAKPGTALLPVIFAPANSFARISFSELLEKSQSGRDLHPLVDGKILLVGAGTPLFQDAVTTPVGQMLGVEAQANVINTLLSSSRLQDSPPLLYWPALWVVTALFGVGAYKQPPGRMLCGLVLWLGIGYCGCRQALVGSNRYVDFLPLLLGPPASTLIGSLWQWYDSHLEQRRLRHLFGRYVSPAVMEELLRDPAQALVGAVGERTITVLFTDINGFSTVCEKKTASQIMTMLNEYFREMNRLIFQHGGSIKQFVGDEIMAMYGAPKPYPKAEQAALETAVAMVRRLRELKKSNPDQEGFYEIKIGIHRGTVILGNVGSEERTEYAAVGDDVNLGSRIMGMNKALKADFLISAEFARHVSPPAGVRFESKGSHPVKGRVEPIEILEVVVEV
jgi:class 3 adenylate cyclase/CHASE2 domain-containing sensor protein